MKLRFAAVDVQATNEDNMMQHYVPDEMSVYSP